MRWRSSVRCSTTDMFPARSLRALAGGEQFHGRAWPPGVSLRPTRPSSSVGPGRVRGRRRAVGLRGRGPCGAVRPGGVVGVAAGRLVSVAASASNVHHVLDLVEVHHALDVVLDLAELAEAAAELPGELGQALGAHHQQGDDEDDQQFLGTDVQHGDLPLIVPPDSADERTPRALACSRSDRPLGRRLERCRPQARRPRPGIAARHARPGAPTETIAARNAPSTTSVTSVASSQTRIHTRMEGCYRGAARAAAQPRVGEELADVARRPRAGSGTRSRRPV